MMQATVFGCSCILGVVLGILYDVFRIIRVIINPKNITVFVQDVIYFLISGAITFLFVLAFNFGELRFYILIGESAGWTLYHVTLGHIIYKNFRKIVATIKNKCHSGKKQQ